MSLIQKIIDLSLTLTYPFLYFGQWGKKQVIYSINGAKFKIRTWTSDKTITNEIFKREAYTFNNEFKIKPGDIVLDIGGHIGVFVVLAARTAKKVLVYEPLKENYDLLNENIKLNTLNNVKSFNVAVSDKAGTVTFFPEKGNVGGSSLYGKNLSKKIKVPATTLQKIFLDNKLKRINFLKLDAEGAEYNILLNAPKPLLKKIDRIVLEFHDYLEHQNHRYHELIRMLEASGFNVQISQSYVEKFLKTGKLKAIRHS
jgi:FkbM family methyltransferase